MDRYLFGATTSPHDYRTYLTRLYGFLVPYESALAVTPGLDEVIDTRSRSKVQFLVQDLLVLGLTMRDIDDLPQCLAMPTFRGPAAAIGWMYVIERPMLASAVIRRHLATRLPTEMALASSYLGCYAGRVGTMWRELGQALDRVASTPAIADRVVVAAHDAFRAQHRWRTHDLHRAALAV